MNTDHRNENLRRKSFETQSLQAASFEGADLRGADFTMADLSNASFRNARFGVPPSIGAAILAAAIALSLAFGVVAGFAIDAVRNRLYGEGWERTSSAAGILIILVVFVVVLFWKGLDIAIRTYLWTFAVVLGASLVDPADLGLRRHRCRGARHRSRTRARARGLVGDRRSSRRWCARSVGYRTRRDHRRARRWPSQRGLRHSGHQRVDGADLETGTPRRPSRTAPCEILAHRLVDRWGTRFVRANLTGADFTGTDASHCDVTGATLDEVQWEPGHAPIAVTNPVTSPDTS